MEEFQKYFWPEMLKFHPYSILTGETMVGFVIYCVLSKVRSKATIPKTNTYCITCQFYNLYFFSFFIISEEQPKQKAVPFYPTAIPNRKPIVIRTTTSRTTTPTTTTTTTTRSTTTTTRSTTTTPTTTTTFKSRRRTVSPRSYPKYKRKLERKKESIQSLKEKVHSNNKEPKTYSYENVPRYHAEQLEPNQGNLLRGIVKCSGVT